MLVAFSSPVNFSKSVFSGVKFRAKFEVVLQKQFLSVAANHSKLDFSTVKWVADSEETRQVYNTEIPSNIATVREENLYSNWLTFYLKLCGEWHTGLCAITAPSYKQPNKLSQLQKI